MKLEQNKPRKSSAEEQNAMAFVIVFFLSLRVCLCMHVSTRGVHDLSGAIVTWTPGRLFSDALASDPIHCGRQGLSLRAADADKLGSEVTPGASGLLGESWSSAKAQVSLQQVFLVLGSTVASYRYKPVLCFV